MPIRRRVIAGEYRWEVEYVWTEIAREPRMQTLFATLYRAYARWTEAHGREPVTPTVFASVLRREARKMRDVSVVEGRWVRWKGLGLRV